MMNVMALEKGKERWGLIADNIWDMLMGRGGKLPGPLAPELQELAKKNGKEPFTDKPQSLYADELEVFIKEMEDNGWDRGEDDEELFELAMHPPQYRAYKSGEAKKAFEEDLAIKRKEGAGLLEGTEPKTGFATTVQPETLFVDVQGEQYKVSVSYEAPNGSTAAPAEAIKSEPKPATVAAADQQEVLSPLEGKFYLTMDNSETPIKVGDTIAEGDLIGYVEAMKTYNAIRSEASGTVVEITLTEGSDVDEDDVLVILS
jgi:pyruvate carboxylase subunit B